MSGSLCQLRTCLHSPENCKKTLPVPHAREGSSLYKPNRYVLPQRVWFLRRFGLKTGIDFAHFGQELGMVFEGTTFQFKMINKEQKICESK